MTCAHGSCTCDESRVVSGGKTFCSQACASAPPIGACSCGHPACRTGARSGISNPTRATASPHALPPEPPRGPKLTSEDDERR